MVITTTATITIITTATIAALITATLAIGDIEQRKQAGGGVIIGGIPPSDELPLSAGRYRKFSQPK
jgi:hypothetical protein